jgi:uncharacterized membrane protein YeaQ/YmgE (transglycosylase-associated protein family)
VIGTIIGAIVVGLIVGALARLVMPGKQNIGVVVTVLLGVLGSTIGSWLTYDLLGYDGFAIVPFLVGVIVAILLIAGYLGITGKRSSRGNAVRR